MFIGFDFLYLELIKLQCLRNRDQLLHLSHLSDLRVALIYDLKPHNRPI